MAYSVTKEFHFSAAHRIPGHPKCGRLHGHNYRVLVTAELTSVHRIGDLDPEWDWVIDFGELKIIGREVIDGMLDHKTLFGNIYMIHEDLGVRQHEQDLIDALDPEECAFLSVDHTTAEALAAWIARAFQERVQPEITITRVDLWETATGMATWRIV